MKNALSMPIHRLAFYLALYAYFFAIQYGAIHYLPYQALAPGIFSESSYTFWRSLGNVAILSVTILFVPTKICRPSQLFFFCVYLIVYIPSVAMDSVQASAKMTPLLLSFTAGVSVLGFIASLSQGKSILPMRLSSLILALVAGLQITLMLLLYAEYGGIMSFASLDQTYEQRELGKADSMLHAYAQTYLVYFASAFILAAGMVYKKSWLIILGLSGYALLYLITAERTALLLPVVMLALCVFSQRLEKSLKPVTWYLIITCFVVAVVSANFESSATISALGFYYYTRIIAVPGQFVLDYAEFFGKHGHTLFTHIKGFDLLLDPPSIYALNQHWPALGWIVGTEWHLIDSNSNASFVASDGIASLGVIGPLVMCIMLSIFVYILDWVTRGMPSALVLPAVFPIAFALTNGSLFTMLLSYGGFAFLFLFVAIDYRSVYKRV